jgi:hypothetical protein
VLEFVGHGPSDVNPVDPFKHAAGGLPGAGLQGEAARLLRNESTSLSLPGAALFHPAIQPTHRGQVPT